MTFRKALRATFCAASLLSPAIARALPGDASAVLAHCGAPASDYQNTSEVTGRIQRNITYGNVILHFDNSGGGWSYLSAWDGHMPISKEHVGRLMPCFGDALEEVAASPAAAADPTLSTDQAAVPPGIKFNRTFLILLFVLAAILIVSVAIPATRRRKRAALPMEARPFRKPRVAAFRFGRSRRVSAERR